MMFHKYVIEIHRLHLLLIDDITEKNTLHLRQDKQKLLFWFFFYRWEPGSITQSTVDLSQITSLPSSVNVSHQTRVSLKMLGYFLCTNTFFVPSKFFCFFNQ